MKTIYLLGNGPSLNKVDVTALHNKETISFNRAFIAYSDWGFDPSIYMAIDPVVIKNTQEDVKRLIRESAIKSFILPADWKNVFGSHDNVTYVRFRKKIWPRGFYWGSNLNKMSVIANVGATAVPILEVLGYNRVVILGTDCNYEEQKIQGVEVQHNEGDKDRRIVYRSKEDSDPNHFRPDYFGKGTEYSKPQAGNHYNGWKFISENFGKKGIKVELCSPGSRLEGLFPSISTEEIG